MFANSPFAANPFAPIDGDPQSFTIESGHKQEFHVRDLETRSVTLFPSRAQIVRDIKDVGLKAGPNHIIITGLSPTIDEHSIKVEGSGSAIISNIAVINRPNPESFEDIYPESEEDFDTDSESEDDDDDSDKEDEAITSIQDKVALLRDEEKRAKEVIASAESRLKILDSYSKTLTTERKRKDEVNIGDGVETYRAEREKVFQNHMEGTVKIRAITKQLADLEKEGRRLQKIADKEKAKASKAKAKLRKAKEKSKEKKTRKRESVAKEKARTRQERENFWPKKIYMVKVTLDAANFTPMTSRRSSISSDIVKLEPEPEKLEREGSAEDEYVGMCDLTISYVTTCAYWSPNYDLALSTTTNSGSLCFDARLSNLTAETWSNCKVILSTSQADFSGIFDTIPTLVPWRVKLAGKGNAGSSNDILYSRDELSRRSDWNSQQTIFNAQAPRWQLFGVDKPNNSVPPALQAPPPPPPPAAIPPPAPVPRSGGLFGSASVSMASKPSPSPFGVPAPGGAFGSMATQSQPVGGGLYCTAAPRVANAPPQYKESARQASSNTTSGFAAETGTAASALFGGATINEAQPELSFQESSFEETGLTSTYDLPGLKTLAPSSTPSKQRVVRITFTSVTFSHTVVAKYKPAAYLKARVRNGSQLTVLRGSAGLTLDGSFLGRTTLPRCSPGDSFTLSLGVDPAIRVAYPKPDVKRSQSGLFSKEDSGVYTRVITLVNTRSGGGGGANRDSPSTSGAATPKPVKLTVLDQVPVSEDEKLRIDILQPRGLTINGVGVVAGVPGREGKDEKDWGKAVATLKKGGEVSWDVTLNPGRMVKLSLEYEASFPSGDQVANV
ncbi:hypothetical protein BX600DRAFT_441470 [Xylariales sp. PMI_506]|nr:hypothetical protein BX600DRAFT_441470 [Xylariales sp. PMI_506]